VGVYLRERWTAGVRNLARRAASRLGDRFPAESVSGALLVLIFAFALTRSVAWSHHYWNPPSRLPGSAALHLPAPVEERYLFLANSIRANCDILFSLPVIGSLNFWSGVPTPNGSNVTAWMVRLSPDRQQDILRKLQSNRRACAVVQLELAGAWDVTGEEMEKLPLARYILHDMRSVAERDGYEIRVHPLRSSPWVAADQSAEIEQNR